MRPSGVVGPLPVQTADGVAACGADDCAVVGAPLVVSRPRFQATLTWGAAPSDLDSHFTGPLPEQAGRFHISYGDRGAAGQAPFATLDTDDTDSEGPKITTRFRCLPGTYRYAIHNYSGAPPIDPATTRVRVLLPDGATQMHQPPAGESGDVWLVGDLDCQAGCDCRWTPLDRYGPADDSSYHPEGAR